MLATAMIAHGTRKEMAEFTVYSMTPNVEVTGLRGFSRSSGGMMGWALSC